jgi:hypothetical protein
MNNKNIFFPFWGIQKDGNMIMIQRIENGVLFRGGRIGKELSTGFE